MPELWQFDTSSPGSEILQFLAGSCDTASPLILIVPSCLCFDGKTEECLKRRVCPYLHVW